MLGKIKYLITSFFTEKSRLNNITPAKLINNKLKAMITVVKIESAKISLDVVFNGEFL